jgi:hypothetical protein
MSYTSLGRIVLSPLTIFIYVKSQPVNYDYQLEFNIYTLVGEENIPVDTTQINLNELFQELYSVLFVKPLNALDTFNIRQSNDGNHIVYVDINEKQVTDTKFSGLHQLLFDTRFNGDRNDPAYSTKSVCNTNSNLINYLNRITNNQTYQQYRFGLEYTLSGNNTEVTFYIISLNGDGMDILSNDLLVNNVLKDVEYSFNYDSYTHTINDTINSNSLFSFPRKDIKITFTNLVEKTEKEKCDILKEFIFF